MKFVLSSKNEETGIPTVITSKIRYFYLCGTQNIHTSFFLIHALYLISLVIMELKQCPVIWCVMNTLIESVTLKKMHYEHTLTKL